jgi:hypothetical protein
MRVLYSLKNNFKIALALTTLLVALMLSGYFEKHYLKSIDQGFSSMFADRLVPATDMFLIADQFYERRMLLQAFLLSPEEVPMPLLCEQQESIDFLLAKYQATYLVEEETVCLTSLVAKWKAYQEQEARILALASQHNTAGAILLFSTEGKELFRSIITDLEQLTRIQSQVGKNLMDSSKSNIASTNSILSFQSALIIIVALIINIFLLASKALVRPQQKFHLN